METIILYSSVQSLHPNLSAVPVRHSDKRWSTEKGNIITKDDLLVKLICYR